MARGDRIRENIERWGLRAVCLVCRTRLRFFPGRVLEAEGNAERVFRNTASRRLREVPCPYCAAAAGSVRSYYWAATHPELARVAADRARQLHHALK